MRRLLLRLTCITILGVGAQFASPGTVHADPPSCPENPASLCSPPPNYGTCSATCTANPTGILFECIYRPFQCMDE